MRTQMLRYAEALSQSNVESAPARVSCAPRAPAEADFRHETGVIRRCSHSRYIRERWSCTAPNTRGGTNCPVLPAAYRSTRWAGDACRTARPVGDPLSEEFFEPPGQGGRREGRDQEEGNKTSAHCGSPCRKRTKTKMARAEAAAAVRYPNLSAKPNGDGDRRARPPRRGRQKRSPARGSGASSNSLHGARWREGGSHHDQPANHNLVN